MASNYVIIFQRILMQDRSTFSSRLKGCVQSFSDRVGRQNFGLILMGLSMILWPISFIFPGQHKMSPIETNLIRAAVGVISHFFILKYFDLSFNIKSESNLRIILLRNVIIWFHVFALAGILFILPYSVVFTIENSCALFVFIIDYYLFKVKINRKQVYGVIWGFVGVLLTVNGGFLMSLIHPQLEKQTDFKNYLTDDPYLKLLAGCMFVLINFFRAYSLCIIKSIKGMKGVELSFHFSAFMIITFGIGYFELVSHKSSLSTMLQGALYSGIPQNIVQILFATAIVLTKNTGITNLMCFISIAIGYFISLFHYNQPLNLICLVGVALIFFGIFRTISTREEHQK